MKLLSQEIVLALLRVKGTKEPNLVFLDWSTDIKTCIDFGKSVRSSARERKLIGLAYEALRREIAKGVAVTLVTTTLGNDVENTTRAAPIFCAEGAGLYFHFLNELERKVGARSAEGGVR